MSDSLFRIEINTIINLGLVLKNGNQHFIIFENIIKQKPPHSLTYYPGIKSQHFNYYYYLNVYFPVDA